MLNCILFTLFFSTMQLFAMEQPISILCPLLKNETTELFTKYLQNLNINIETPFDKAISILSSNPPDPTGRSAIDALEWLLPRDKDKKNLRYEKIVKEREIEAVVWYLDSLQSCNFKKHFKDYGITSENIFSLVDKQGNNLLHRAALLGRSCAIIYLSKNYPDLVYSKNNMDRIPLHMYITFLHKNPKKKNLFTSKYRPLFNLMPLDQ